MRTQMDHLVIGATSLEEGIEYVQRVLQVDIPYGGCHMKMGTHNHLMQIGGNAFLEVIAINSELEAPSRPRWYGLDDTFIQQRIKEEPVLLTWVINTEDIDRLSRHALFPTGKAEVFSRGELSWYFGLPEDGSLIGGGMLPYVIEWQTDVHPSLGMANLGCNLHSLEIFHPYPLWLENNLKSIGALDLVEINALPTNVAPYLIANFSTPSGIRKLSSKIGY